MSTKQTQPVKQGLARLEQIEKEQWQLQMGEYQRQLASGEYQGIQGEYRRLVAEDARKADEAQQQIKAREYQNLVAEVRSRGFVYSSEVSRYISNNRLGYKYPNISGFLEMEKDGKTYVFEGGFPPKIYASLCYELGLENNGSNANPVNFESYTDRRWRSKKDLSRN